MIRDFARLLLECVVSCAVFQVRTFALGVVLCVAGAGLSVWLTKLWIELWNVNVRPEPWFPTVSLLLPALSAGFLLGFVCLAMAGTVAKGNAVAWQLGVAKDAVLGKLSGDGQSSDLQEQARRNYSSVHPYISQVIQLPKRAETMQANTSEGVRQAVENIAQDVLTIVEAGEEQIVLESRVVLSVLFVVLEGLGLGSLAWASYRQIHVRV